MRVAIYTRISDDRNGEEAGVDRQRDACVELADRLGWEIAEVFSDNDTSAYSGRTRPGFEALLDAMKRKEVDALICWHTDRLYRRLSDLVRLLDVASGMEVRTVRGGDIDLSNASGRMIATILGSVSMNESEHHAERRREANKARALAGQWCSTGIRPFGFNSDGTHREPEASMIRQAVGDILSGTSLHAVARDWNARGVTTVKGVKWSNLHLRRVLVNPRLAALQVHQRKVIGTGNWEPILDADTYHGIVALINDPSRKNGLAFERRHLLSGIAKCGICGNALYAQWPHGKDQPKVYTCRPSSHLGRNGVMLDRYIEMLVLGYLSDEGVGRQLSESDNSVDLGLLRTQRGALQARLDDLAAMFAANEIDGSQLRRGSVDLRQQLAGIDSTLAEAARVSPVAALLEDSSNSDQTLLECWDGATPDIRGKIVAELMDIVVNPAPKGVKDFDPDLIEIRWR